MLPIALARLQLCDPLRGLFGISSGSSLGSSSGSPLGSFRISTGQESKVFLECLFKNRDLFLDLYLDRCLQTTWPSRSQFANKKAHRARNRTSPNESIEYPRNDQNYVFDKWRRDATRVDFALDATRADCRCLSITDHNERNTCGQMDPRITRESCS